MSLTTLRTGDLVALYTKEGAYRLVARIISTQGHYLSIFPVGSATLLRFNKQTGVVYQGAKHGVKGWYVKPYEE